MIATETQATAAAPQIDYSDRAFCTLTRHRTAKHRFQVVAARQYLVRYLVWEFGPIDGGKIAEHVPAFGPIGYAATRRDAEQAVTRIRNAINWSRGADGKPAHMDCGVFAERMPGR
jgi:hypothetical protein